MRLLATLLALALLNSFIASWGPALAADASTVEVGSASTVTGGTVKVLIEVKNITGGPGLGGYDLQVRFDPAALRIVNLGPGGSPYFAMPISNINNVEGIVYLNGFQTKIPGPTGNVSLASLEILALAGGKHKLEVKVITLADTQGNDMTATPVNGAIEVTPGPAVEAGSSFVPQGQATSIPVIFKNMPEGVSSYSLKIAFSSPSVKIAGVKGGEAPFDKAPANTIDPAQPAVTLEGQVNAAAGPGPVTVARIDISAAAAGKISATFSSIALKGTGGAAITANGIPAELWVLPPATIEVSSPTLTVGEYEAINISLKNIPSIVGLGSYQFEVTYDPKIIKVARVTDWPMPDKTAVAASNTLSEGKIVARGTVNKKPGPVGNASVLEIVIQGMAGGQTPINVAVTGIQDTAGKPLEVTAKPGLVIVKEFTTVHIGSAPLTVGTGGKIAITVTDYPDADGLGNAWIEIAYPQRVLEISNIEAGDAPFEKPPQRQTVGLDAPAGIITLTTLPAKPRSTSEITLATLTVMPLAEGDFKISLRGGNLNNSSNQPISAKAVEGLINAKSPFKISNMAIAPRQPNINEKATLTAAIVNTGTTRGAYPTRLWIGTALQESGSIDVEPGATRNISFGVSRDQPGLYKAMLGEADLQFTVADPAKLKASGFTVSPAAPRESDLVTVSEQVQNTGAVEALYTARLKLNQTLRDSREISLKPGEKRDVVFPLGNLPAGSYAIDLDGQTASLSVSGGGAGPSSSSPLTLVLGLLAAAEAAALVLLVVRKKHPNKA